MLSVLAFLIILAPLVIVHEFGHYIFAKMFNVKAEVFSVGFGPKIWSKMLGETDFRVSAIPLGGYVKLLGEDSEANLTEAEKKRALHHQTKWRRFFIFFGGPLFNFLFAILVYMAILVIGEPQVANVVGRVVEGSQAALSGFRTGDKILSVNEKPTKFYSEIMMEINQHPNEPVSFKVLHPGASSPVTMTVLTSSEPGYTMYGEEKNVGRIDGLLPTPRGNKIGISNLESFAAKAGIKTSDELIEFNGKPINNWEEFESFYVQASHGLVSLKIKDANNQIKNIQLKKPKASINPSTDWGLYSSELFIKKVLPQSPAEGGGLKPGDRIIKIGTEKINSFFEMKEVIQTISEKKQEVEVVWEREGKQFSKLIKPTANSERDPTLKKTIQYTIGVEPNLVYAEPVMVIERIWNPFVLIFESTKRMVVLSWRNFVSIGKMVTGEVSMSTLGGPILIGKIAGDSLARGLIAFLTTMAILSIGLGVLNILPVPVLDGGHIILLGVEAIRGKRLSMRQMEIVQQVGLSLILLLMVVVMKNDLLRLPLFN